MKKILTICFTACAMFYPKAGFSQEKNDAKPAIDTIIASKGEKNRNEMLNAENSTGPRNVNIGLPFGGDIVILENDVPVVYYFYPTLPTAAWRNGTSLAKTGLLTFAEGALTFGKVGFAVQSSDREAGSKFKGFAQISGTSFGSSKFDVTLTGPLGKKGWGYMASFYTNHDRLSGVNYMYTLWNDKTNMMKFSIQKKYKKGSVSLLFKHVDNETVLMNYSPLQYDGNGKTSQLPNFELGSDSYILRDGMLPYYDIKDGSRNFADMGSDKFMRSISDNLYLSGNHKFDNGWKLTYTSMFQKMNTPFGVTVPLSLLAYEPDQQGTTKYYFYDTNKQWTGTVQAVINNVIPQSDNTTSITRAEITKKINKHDLRLGFTYQYNHRKYQQYGGMYYQTVEANPRLLDYYANGTIKVTNGGLMPASAGGYGNLFEDSFKKAALYFSDDVIINRWLSVGFGGRIEHQNKHEVKNPYVNNEIVGDMPLITKDFKDDWNKVGIGSLVVKLTKDFGLLADGNYNSWMDSYWDYTARDANGNPIAGPGEAKPRQTIPNTFQTSVKAFSGGIYYNYGNALSIVSKVTSISKDNIRASNTTVTNPANPAERANFDPLFYDIKTLGWSTDVVTSPFKNFNLHFLVTLQDPQYKNYALSAFNVTYDYSNKIIPELSKVLLEIDPSYSFMDGALRAWFSLRYFGKQYANPTNAFSYNSRWENFGGLDYNISRSVGLKLQVINFLDQKGVKGAIQGADQITSDAAYIGRTVVANNIRPRTIELTLNLKF